MSDFEIREGSSSVTTRLSGVHEAVFVALILCAAALLGIMTRPMGQLALFWPANALLLGMMVRWPSLNRPICWGAAAIGYLCAGALTGDTLFSNLLWTAANMTGAGAGVSLYRFFDEEDRYLRRPASVAAMVAIAGMSSIISGVMGAIAGTILNRSTLVDGWIVWFVSEWVNYIALLPVILSFDGRTWPHKERRRAFFTWASLKFTGPLIAFAFGCFFAMVTAGPGAAVFPIPALLWAATTNSRFYTAVLTLTYLIWLLVCYATGYMIIGTWGITPRELMSVRMAISVLCLGPIAVACVMASRNELQAELEQLANHDMLTGLLNRRAFFAKTEQAILERQAGDGPMALLMVDIDHFKAINDSHGHAAGDTVLRIFATRARTCVRASDTIGRIGGEEFAILLLDCPLDHARAIAERLRSVFADRPVDLGGGQSLPITISIGLAYCTTTEMTLEQGLHLADQALYDAKSKGRNRVELHVAG